MDLPEESRQDRGGCCRPFSAEGLHDAFALRGVAWSSCVPRTQASMRRLLGCIAVPELRGRPHGPGAGTRSRPDRRACLVSTRKQLAVVITSAILLAACSGSAAVEGDTDTNVDAPSAAETVAPAPNDPAPKDPGLVPLIDTAALDPCPPGVSNPDAAIPGLPDVTYRCLGYGPDVNLSTLRGTPLVVNVWASWCPPCIAEMPILTSAAADLRGEVQFLGIDIQDQDASALEMMTAFGADFPSVVDQSGEIRGLLAISGPPVTFFVNEQGVIVGRHDGALPSTEYFNALLDQYLGVSR